MTGNRQLSALESSIRTAVATGAYEEAGRLLASYSRQLPACGDRIGEEIRRAADLFDWIFRMVMAARSHDTAQLAALERTAPYRNPKTNPIRSWELEG